MSDGALVPISDAQAQVLVPIRDAEAKELVEKISAGVMRVDPTKVTRSTATKSDRRIDSALTALEEGRMLIDLSKVAEKMRVGSSYGRIALGPATRQGKRVTRTRDKVTGDQIFHSGRWSLIIPGEPDGSYVRGLSAPTARTRRARALIPYVPPEIRQRVDSLHGKLVLWEQTWIEQPERLRMQLDPALIEHVVGMVYTVHGVWELTELERAALGGG